MTPYEISERVWQHTEPNNWSTFHGHVRRNAIQTIIAHLELLRTAGDVERSEEEPHRYALVARAAQRSDTHLGDHA